MDALVHAVERAAAAAAAADCVDMLAFATSALRDAANCDDVVDVVRAETGVVLRMLPGEDEARYTFLAARRWYGWSAGRLLVVDIGGGSLELATGRDEDPDVAESLPLGAARLAREWFTSDPPSSREIAALAEFTKSVLAPVAGRVRSAGDADLVVGTSKTLRSLARLTGAAPSGAGLCVRRVLTHDGLRQILAFISRMASSRSRRARRRESAPGTSARCRRAGGRRRDARPRRASSGDLSLGAAGRGHPASARHAQRDRRAHRHRICRRRRTASHGQRRRPFPTVLTRTAPASLRGKRGTLWSDGTAAARDGVAISCTGPG